MEDMKQPKTVDEHKPADVYSQSYDQKPTEYMARQDAMQKKEASKLKAQSYKGRYN